MLKLIFIFSCSFAAGLISFIYLAQTGIKKILVERKKSYEQQDLYNFFEPLLTKWFIRERYLNLAPIAIAVATAYFLFKLLE